MSRRFAVFGAISLALPALTAAAAPRDDAQPRTRVTIRGSGSDVAIERAPALARRTGADSIIRPAGVLGEALRMKTEGADDAAVLEYLRRNEVDLPPVLEAEDLKRLRRAGAGRDVLAYIAGRAAVDIGPTAQREETAAAMVPEPAIDSSADYDLSYPYPVFTGDPGYGAPSRRAGFAGHGRFFRRFPSRRAFVPHRVPRPGRMIPPRPSVRHGVGPRRPTR